MTNIVRRRAALIGSIAVFLLSSGFLRADIEPTDFEQTAFFDVLADFKDDYVSNITFNLTKTSYLSQPTPVTPLQSITPTSPQRPATSEPATLALTLTDFLIDRATHELVARFLHNMTNSSDKSSFESLMPTMTVFLGKLDNYEVSALVPAFRSAAIDDLNNLIGNLLSYYSLEHRKTQPNEGQQDLLMLLNKVHSILKIVRSGTAPGVAIERLSEIGNSNTCNSISLRTVGILSREWVYSNTKIKVDSKGITTLRSFILDNEENKDSFFSYLGKKLNFPSSPEVHKDLLYGVFSRLDQVDKLFEREKVLVPVEDVLRVTIGTIEFVAREICSDQSAQNNAVNVLLEAYLATTRHRYTDLVTTSFRFLDSLYGNDLSSDGTRITKKIPVPLERLIVLAASVAEANTSEDVWDILQSFADPVGSFATKRASGAHVTIGAYFGVMGGFEIVDNNLGYQIGLALPVGIELSFGLDECCSLGFFLAPLDLGVIASYRLTGDVSNPSPNVGWRQLLSPSAYFVLGFPKDDPFAVALGAQYAPELRTVGADTVSAFRVSLMLAVDLTLFRF